MADEFHIGYDPGSGWRVLHGPGHLDLQAVVAGFGAWDIHPPLGFVGHQPGYPDWQVIIKPPGSREVRGLLLQDAEYARYDYDPYKAARDGLRLEFVRPVMAASVLRRRAAPAPVPVDDPDYLPVAYGLFRGVDIAGRKKSYWSVLPPTFGPARSPLSWFVSRSEGAVPVARLEALFPPIEDHQPVQPAAPPPTPPSAGDLAAAIARMEAIVRDAVAGLLQRVEDLTDRVAALERRGPALAADPARLDRLEIAVREASGQSAQCDSLADDLAKLRADVARLAPPAAGSGPASGNSSQPSAGDPATRRSTVYAGSETVRRDWVLGVVVVAEATLCLLVLGVILALNLIRHARS